MGGTSTQSQTQSSQTAPWVPAQPMVQGLISGVQGLQGNTGLTSPEQGAIDQLTANGQGGNPYAGGTSSAVANMLAGGGALSQAPTVQAAYDKLQGNLSPYLDPNYSTINSPAVQSALAQVASDTTNQVNGQFASAGRSFSGANQQALSRGIASGEAPIILNQANQDTQNRIAAANNVYSAGNQTAGTISGMGQNYVTNQNAGIGNVGTALTNSNWGPQSIIAAQELAKSIPASNLGLLAQIGIPLAQLGQTSNGTSNGSATESGAQQFAQIGQGAAGIGKLLFG